MLEEGTVKEPKKEIYNEVWFFYKKYLNCPEESWEQLTREAQELIKKHGNDVFVRELLYAVINEIGRQ